MLPECSSGNIGSKNNKYTDNTTTTINDSSCTSKDSMYACYSFRDISMGGGVK